MPTYEYECSKCKYIFEEFQNITDKPLKHCPRCKGNLRRIISGGAGFILKGSGFYATDYKKPQLPVKAEEKSKALAKSMDKSSSTTEKTPQALSGTSDDAKKQ
jgi:putative FmdB family regulatory protein